MPRSPLKIVKVSIERAEGWYVAKSDDMPGLLVAHTNLDKVWNDVPTVIEAMYRSIGQTVMVCESEPPKSAASSPDRWWIPIPKNGGMNHAAMAAG